LLHPAFDEIADFLPFFLGHFCSIPAWADKKAGIVNAVIEITKNTR
jgi:hypothetical protein